VTRRRHGADLVLREQDGDPLVRGAPVNSHHRRRHDVPDPLRPSAVVLPGLALGMPVPPLLQRAALTEVGCGGLPWADW